MKKNAFSVLALAVAATLFFSACSKNESEKVTLTVWESKNGPDEFIKQAGKAYTKLHPNVTIEYVNVESGEASNQIAIDGPAGSGPDLFAAPHDRVGEFASNKYVVPTEDPQGVKKEVLPSCAKALTYEGTMYGYPVSAETYVLFYNKDLISEDEVPDTWDNLSIWVKDFNERHPDKKGFMMDVNSGYYTIIFTTGANNRLFGTYGNESTKSYLNTPAAVQGMKFFQSLRKTVDMPAEELTTDIGKAEFKAGRLAMFITGLWDIRAFEDMGLNFGIAPLPSLPGENTPCASFSGVRTMFVSAFSAHQEEAASFARFLLTPEMQQLRFNLTGAVPAINTQLSSKYTDVFMKQLDCAFPMPSLVQMNTFWTAFGDASTNIWNGADVKRELDACNAAIVGE